VAHEIKNPLTPISLSANLLRRARDEQSPEFDQILDRTVDLMQRQVENLRQISQNFYAFAGERQLEPRPTDLRALAGEVLELNAAWAAELGVQVELLGEAREVRIDPTELRRVLINLVSNALESMPKGGHLQVSLEETDQEARVAVRDTGTGISREATARLFEPYFTTRSHGTGLGLAICKRVIDEMGGQLSLEPISDELGNGTLALIVLPRS
jgi:nitrogen fixation/metabolism regulation signal transduction histidine kinase